MSVRTAEELRQLRSLSPQEAVPLLDLLDKALDHLNGLGDGKKTKRVTELLVHELEILDEKLLGVRNAIAHGAGGSESRQLPAYRLDDGNDDG